MIKVFTDSTTSLPADLVKSTGVQVVSLFVRYKDKEYDEATMDIDAFYQDIHDMADNPPTTSQPSPAKLEALFEECARKGEEVLGIWISSGLSGTFDGVCRAAHAVRERYQDFHFAMVDSCSNSFDQALPVLDGVAAVKAGKSLMECAQEVVKGVAASRFIFSPESLTFLQKGGRIGNAKALLGNLLKICPVLTVVDGIPVDTAQVRTHKKALARMVKILQNDINNSGGLKDLVVHYIGDGAPARKWATETIEPLINRAVRVLPASPVIGCHVGPSMGLAYECYGPVKGKLTKDPSELIYAE